MEKGKVAAAAKQLLYELAIDGNVQSAAKHLSDTIDEFVAARPSVPAQGQRSWTEETMTIINKLTPDIKGKAFDPDWFLLRQRFEEIERQHAPEGQVSVGTRQKIAQEVFDLAKRVQKKGEWFTGGYLSEVIRTWNRKTGCNNS